MAKDVLADRPTVTEDLVDPKTGQPNPDSEMTMAQAYETYKQFVQDNKDRNGKNARIQKKRDGEQPYQSRKLKTAGQSWRNNRSTGFMNSMLKRLAPPFKQMVDQLPYLTYSHFPVKNIGTEAQQDKFRKGITSTIRNWPGWPELLSQIIDENSTFGYAGAGSLDEWDWKMDMFRGDEAYFPVGCPQEANEMEIWGLRKDMPIHKAMEKFRDPKASSDAGWQVEDLAKKLNNAEKQFKDYSSDNQSRIYEDLIRENNLASTFTSSIKVVKLGHIIARSPTGGINHYTFDRDDGTAIYFKRNKWKTMADALALFSAEVGDRTMHGSKGAGRALYNTHVTVEQARNLIYDALHLNGLLVVRRTKKDAGTGQTQGPMLTVNHPFAIIGDGYEVVEKAEFKIDSESFFALDQHATAMAEIQIGTFMPGQLNKDGEAKTASEINYTASVDAQIKAGVLSRFADQIFNLVDLIQKRLCHPDVVAFAEEMYNKTKDADVILIYDENFFANLVAANCQEGFVYVDVPLYLDKDAVACIIGMLADGLTKKQILILANSNSRANVDDAIAAQSGVLDMIVARYMADPMIDTVELKRRDISRSLGADAAERLMNVDLNPLSDLKQGRGQLSELSIMLDGNAVPIDPTDNDKVHLAVIQDRMVPMLKYPAIQPLAESQAFIQNVVDHSQAHIDSALQKGGKPADFADAQATVNKLKQYLQVPPMNSDISSAISQLPPGAAPVGAPNGPTPPVPPAPTRQPTAGDLITQLTATPPPPGAAPSDVVSAVAAPARPTPP